MYLWLFYSGFAEQAQVWQEAALLTVTLKSRTHSKVNLPCYDYVSLRLLLVIPVVVRAEARWGHRQDK